MIVQEAANDRYTNIGGKMISKQTKEEILEWLQDQWGEGETLVDVLKNASAFLNSLLGSEYTEYDVQLETDTEIALRKIDECIEMSRKETNTMYTLPLLSEVINRLQQEEE